MSVILLSINGLNAILVLDILINIILTNAILKSVKWLNIILTSIILLNGIQQSVSWQNVVAPGGPVTSITNDCILHCVKSKGEVRIEDKETSATS